MVKPDVLLRHPHPRAASDASQHPVATPPKSIGVTVVPVDGLALLIRVLLALVGFALLRWAYAILDNIWNYNDSGTAAYVIYSLVPGLPGVLCVYLAIRGPNALRRR
jgi:hypothetical protein